MATINSAKNLSAKLAMIAAKTDGLPRVSVGFLAGSSYPDGTSIAAVAGSNEFGVPANNQPPRPFFRRMVAEKKGTWGKAVGLQLKATDFDVAKTLDRTGQAIKAQLQTSIRDLTDPPLSPVTIAKKGSSKPLIDSATMLKSVDYRVDGT